MHGLNLFVYYYLIILTQGSKQRTPSDSDSPTSARSFSRCAAFSSVPVSNGQPTTATTTSGNNRPSTPKPDISSEEASSHAEFEHVEDSFMAESDPDALSQPAVTLGTLDSQMSVCEDCDSGGDGTLHGVASEEDLLPYECDTESKNASVIPPSQDDQSGEGRSENRSSDVVIEKVIGIMDKLTDMECAGDEETETETTMAATTTATKQCRQEGSDQSQELFSPEMNPKVDEFLEENVMVMEDNTVGGHSEGQVLSVDAMELVDCEVVESVCQIVTSSASSSVMAPCGTGTGTDIIQGLSKLENSLLKSGQLATGVVDLQQQASSGVGEECAQNSDSDHAGPEGVHNDGCGDKVNPVSTTIQSESPQSRSEEILEAIRNMENLVVDHSNTYSSRELCQLLEELASFSAAVYGRLKGQV